MTYRVSPAEGQSICIEYLTGYLDVKVTVKLHFCSGGKRFYLRVSRDQTQKLIDYETMASPAEIRYEREKRIGKFYITINFQNACVVNVCSEVRLLPKQYLPSKKEEDPSSGKRPDDDPTSKNYHSNLIYELERMEILPPGMQSDSDSVAFA